MSPGTTLVGKRQKEEKEKEKENNNKKKKVVASEEETDGSDSNESSESSSGDNSDNSSTSSNSSSGDNSDNSSTSSNSSSDNESEEDKPKQQPTKDKRKAKAEEMKGKAKSREIKGKAKAEETKGKVRAEEVNKKGSKNLRSDEESFKEQNAIKPQNKKVKHGVLSNDDTTEEKPITAEKTVSTNEVEGWRRENQLTVVNVKDNSVDTTAPYANFDDAPFPGYIKNAMKDYDFEKPTPIQAQAWPLINQRKDIIGIAETGSGKTLAFGYPAIVAIKKKKKQLKGPKVLVLAPTRELAQQIHEVLARACSHADLTACCIFGGADKEAQANKISSADIVVATPGRLIDLLQGRYANLSHVTYLVFDEADRMLDMGFIPQIRVIVDTLPQERQTLMFSATWPVDVQMFANTYLSNPVHITIGKSGGENLAGAANITQIIEVCPENERRKKINEILRRLCTAEGRPRILLFMLYKHTCDSMYEELLNKNYYVEILHGGKTQNLRDKAVANFKSGASNILVATDVAARGLDIKDIKYVINGEMPLVMEDYIHRIGRTGRAGESGSAYTVFSEQDKIHARQLVRILEEGSHVVPPELAKIAETAPVTKPKKTSMESMYGDFARGVDAEQMKKKPTRIVFD